MQVQLQIQLQIHVKGVSTCAHGLGSKPISKYRIATITMSTAIALESYVKLHGTVKNYHPKHATAFDVQKLLFFPGLCNFKITKMVLNMLTANQAIDESNSKKYTGT